MVLEMALDPRVLGATLTLLVVFLLLYLTLAGFSMVGITPLEVVVLLFVAPFLAWVNLPIWRVEGVLFGVNAAGAIIPVWLSLRFVTGGRLPAWKALVGITAVTAVAYYVAQVTENGILVPALPIVATALAAGLVLSAGRWRQVGPATYASGAVGTLIGADLLHVPDLIAAPGSQGMFAVIGGAGTLDAIFLVALIAVIGGIVVVAVTRLFEPRAH